MLKLQAVLKCSADWLLHGQWYCDICVVSIKFKNNSLLNEYFPENLLDTVQKRDTNASSPTVQAMIKYKIHLYGPNTNCSDPSDQRQRDR